MHPMEVFVVRVWPDRSVFHGRVEHVQTGAAVAFAGGDALLAFLGDHLPNTKSGGEQDSPAHAPSGGRGGPPASRP